MYERLAKKPARRRRQHGAHHEHRVTSGETQTTPKVIAILKHIPGVRYIDIEILHEDGRRFEHHVVAASEEDRWSMAECLTATFRGDDGTLADTHEFNRLLGLLAG